MILVPSRNSILAVTNLDATFPLWKKSLDNANTVIADKGPEWFLKNASTWFTEDWKSNARSGGTK